MTKSRLTLLTTKQPTFYLRNDDIRVATYWSKLLPRAALAKKLHQAVRHARLSLAQTKA